MSRVPKRECLTCAHHQERTRTGIVQARRAGRPPSDPATLHRECTWYSSPDASGASLDQRVVVMTAEFNGGRDCPARTPVS